MDSVHTCHTATTLTISEHGPRSLYSVDAALELSSLSETMQPTNRLKSRYS